MKHQLKIPDWLRIDSELLKELKNYCDREEFKNSEFTSPIGLGYTKDREFRIANLPDLGNTLLFGDTGRMDYYAARFYLQIQYANEDIGIVLFDCSRVNELACYASVFFRNIEVITGDTDACFEVFRRIEKYAAERKANKRNRTPLIFFLYFNYVNEIEQPILEHLERLLKDNLNELGIQIIFAIDQIKPSVGVLIPFFHTTIGAYTYWLEEYSELKLSQILVKHSNNSETLYTDEYWIPQNE